MFNISKNTFWFIIIIISIICILCLFYSNNCCSSHNDDYYRYNRRKLSFNNNKLIPIIIENKTNETNKSNETNETIRKKQNRKHTESKKIFISPKKDKNIISIEKIKKQLKNKLTNNKTIKKQYVSNSLNQVTLCHCINLELQCTFLLSLQTICLLGYFPRYVCFAVSNNHFLKRMFL